MKQTVQLFAFFILLQGVCQAQTPDTANSISKINMLTADSLASGNYKDVLTSFFQLAFNDLSGPQKALSFTSNPYAIMLKANPAMAVDTNYLKYKNLRRLNFNFQVLLDSSYHLNGFSLGAKYAIINARDNTVSKDFISRAIKQNDIDTLTNLLAAVVRNPGYPRDLRVKLTLFYDSLMKDSTFTFDKVDKDVQKIIDSIVDQNQLTHLKNLIEQNPKISFRRENQKQYVDLVNEWQRKPLWTIAANSTFKSNPAVANGSNNLTADNIYVSSEFLWGMSPKYKINAELDCIVSDSLSNDITQSQPNLMRNVFTFEPGFNFVFKSKDAGKSLFEFKLSGTYYHIFSKPYASQSADSSTLNATIRLRIINDIWAPITFKLDNNGHVFGSMDLKFNFSTLANVLKNQAVK